MNMAPATKIIVSWIQKRICTTPVAVTKVGKTDMNALDVPCAMSAELGLPFDALTTQEKKNDRPMWPQRPQTAYTPRSTLG
jgi:hypothetical protein